MGLFWQSSFQIFWCSLVAPFPTLSQQTFYQLTVAHGNSEKKRMAGIPLNLKWISLITLL